LKDVEQLDLALSKIPKKYLYKLQMSVAQEVQSRARTDATNLETTREAKEGTRDIYYRSMNRTRGRKMTCREIGEKT
jgi:hypothetical protein